VNTVENPKKASPKGDPRDNFPGKPLGTICGQGGKFQKIQPQSEDRARNVENLVEKEENFLPEE